tara:strand:- start:150 stop:410 length:261 start_codon:yes stop_codon:yes gene_type:complete
MTKINKTRKDAVFIKRSGVCSLLNSSGLSEANIKANKDNALKKIKQKIAIFAGFGFNRKVAIGSIPLQNPNGLARKSMFLSSLEHL